MSNAVATRANGAVARPLKTLVPLIKSEISLAYKAGERHWKAAGRLFNEARNHFPASGPNSGGQTFHEWVADSFVHPMTNEPLAKRTVQQWMEGARRLSESSRSSSANLKSLTDARSPMHEDYKPVLDWQAGVRRVQQTINVEALARDLDDEKKEEREMRTLAEKIIAAGYRALAAVVHPDKPGGSAQAMQKLTKAKKWLEEAIEE